MPTEPQPHVLVTVVRALRALAHPLRNRLLGLLRLHGSSTATRLGELVGESSGSTGYHLRPLAGYGFVEVGRRRPRHRTRAVVAGAAPDDQLRDGGPVGAGRGR